MQLQQHQPVANLSNSDNSHARC